MNGDVVELSTLCITVTFWLGAILGVTTAIASKFRRQIGRKWLRQSEIQVLLAMLVCTYGVFKGIVPDVWTAASYGIAYTAAFGLVFVTVESLLESSMLRKLVRQGLCWCLCCCCGDEVKSGYLYLDDDDDYDDVEYHDREGLGSSKKQKEAIEKRAREREEMRAFVPAAYYDTTGRHDTKLDGTLHLVAVVQPQVVHTLRAALPHTYAFVCISIKRG